MVYDVVIFVVVIILCWSIQYSQQNRTADDWDQSDDKLRNLKSKRENMLKGDEDAQENNIKLALPPIK